MSLAINFALAFLFSFVGSIPPGVLNLTVIQLGLDHKIKIAYRFAFASALVEYPYAWGAIAFQKVLTSYTNADTYLQLVAAIVLVLVGLLNVLLSSETSTNRIAPLGNSGFRRGVILGIINPMALPFWLAATSYLKSMELITFNDQVEVHAYLAGVTLGAFTLLVLVAHLSKIASVYLARSSVIKKLPGGVMIALGLYGIADYFL